MEDVRVGRRYAQALFSAATNLNVVESVQDDLAVIVRLLDTDERFASFLNAPYTGREEKIARAERIFSDRVTALTMQVLRVVLEKRREADIPQIYEEYVQLRRKALGITHVVVTSAFPIDDLQRERLIAKLRQQMGGEVEADFQIEPRMIGGVRVQYANSLLDGSVRGSLNRLRERIKYDLLKQS